MKIGIDARFYGTVGKGLGRYSQKLIENLEKIDSENQYFIFLRKENWNDYEPSRNNFTKVLANIPWYGIREQILFPRLLKKYNLSFVHFPHFNVPLLWRGKFIVTIHDLILMHFPTKRATTLSPLLYSFKKLAYKIVISRAVRRSEKIIAVSEHTKRDLIEIFRIPASKIIVTYEAVDLAQQAPRQSARHVLARYDIIKPYILYVGNAYPHKNLERMLLAFKQILKRHPHLRLVLVGRQDYFYKRLKIFSENNFVNNVVFTDFVADDDLGIIYREALLYFFPSLYEGFGLPPLEAMSRNVPVASSNSTCLPEVLGNAAFYFEPKAISEMAETMEKLILDSELRRNLIKAGANQIKKYSWLNMAFITKKIYEKIK
jgi:glycosyltransferase involved in cell wall biosynthesis